MNRRCDCIPNGEHGGGGGEGVLLPILLLYLIIRWDANE